MDYMFYTADAFNQPLDSWQTGNNKAIYTMFHNAKKFNQPLDSS